MIDPWGRIVEGQRLDPGVMGVIDARLPRPTSVTPYGRMGDWPFLFGLMTAALAGLWPLIRRTRLRANRTVI